MIRHVPLLLALVPACRLDPLVDDTPGASVHVLPRGSVVPSVADSAELATQIALNDGLDDKTLTMTGGVIVRAAGWSDGAQVMTWSFGPLDRVPAPIYVFGRDTAGGFQPVDHPYLLAGIPGDVGYKPIVVVHHVPVTDAYDGELITSLQALSDARDLGLVEEPVSTSTFFDGPVIAPGLVLESGGPMPARPVPAYGRGYAVEMFQLGGTLGVQPIGGYAPSSHVSYLREAMKATHDATRPIFQARIPTAPPGEKANYTPVSTVVHVDLAPGVAASTIVADADLFTRSGSGAITGTTANVAAFTITTTTLNLPMQFAPGVP